MRKIRILVVDNEDVVREGIVAILSLQSDMEVVGEAADGIRAVELARKLKPNVVTLETVLPRQDGITTTAMLKEILPDVRVLVLTGVVDIEKVYRVIKAGAIGYVRKDTTRIQLLEAIREVANGRVSIHQSIALKIINEIDNSPELFHSVDPLTPRELQTLRQIATGRSVDEIAAALHVKDRAVAKYVSSILEKLQLAHRTQAALYAIREGLTEPRMAGDESTDAPPPNEGKKRRKRKGK